MIIGDAHAVSIIDRTVITAAMGRKAYKHKPRAAVKKARQAAARQSAVVRQQNARDSQDRMDAVVAKVVRLKLTNERSLFGVPGCFDLDRHLLDEHGMIKLLRKIERMRDTDRTCPHGPGWVYHFSTLKGVDYARIMEYVLQKKRYSMIKTSGTNHEVFITMWIHRTAY